MTPAPYTDPKITSISSITIEGLLQAAGFLACFASIAGFLGSLHWSLDLFSHFRVQYAAGLMVIALLFLILKAWKSAFLAIMFCVLNLWTLLPLFTELNPADDGTALFRVLTQNVNTQYGNVEQVALLLRNEKADLVALQEIGVRWLPMLDGLADLYPYQQIVPRADNFGIALLSRRPFISAETFIPAYADGVYPPSIQAEVAINSKALQVITTHPPPPIGEIMSRQHHDILTSLPARFVEQEAAVVLGDLNTTRWSTRLQHLLQAGSLNDSAVGFGLQPTWPEGLLPLLIPIDHVFHSSQLRVVNRRTGPEVGSDHRSVIVDLQFRATARQPE